jgi:hypothetical protein
MMITNRVFGAMLTEKLSDGSDIRAVSDWAFQIYLDNSRQLVPELKEVLLDLGRMNDEPEFKYSKRELEALASDLLNR